MTTSPPGAAMATRRQGAADKQKEEESSAGSIGRQRVRLPNYTEEQPGVALVASTRPGIALPPRGRAIGTGSATL
jgi:hypothetical protein